MLASQNTVDPPVGRSGKPDMPTIQNVNEHATNRIACESRVASAFGMAGTASEVKKTVPIGDNWCQLA
jgi:hypothetical protein